MEFSRCSKGHFFDPSVTKTCPQCAAEASAIPQGEYMMDSIQHPPMEMYGATEPVPYGGVPNIPDIGETKPLPPTPNPKNNIGDTLPPAQGNGFTDFPFGKTGHVSKVETYEDATVPVNSAGIAGFTPVVGWLVCIDGPSKGMDYHIRSGYNYIGRADHMDICIKGDNHIGRERHAMLAYDQTERIFFFGPADGKSIVRLNGKMVMVPAELKAYDIVTVGATKLMFVPLCGERFNWDE